MISSFVHPTVTRHRDSIRFLELRAEKRHKASQKKLQYFQKKVIYLKKKKNSESHLEAIRKAPKPRTVREIMTFLGIAGYSSAWIKDYASVTGPLRAIIKDTDNTQLHGNLSWTKHSFLAFETIKQRLPVAPALALPDYSKNFPKPKTGTCYSTAFSDVEMGLLRPT